jgi:hypothetical protein
MALHQFLHRDTFRLAMSSDLRCSSSLASCSRCCSHLFSTDVWSDYQGTAEAINKECASLHGVAILSQSLPASLRDATLTALRGYFAYSH